MTPDRLLGAAEDYLLARPSCPQYARQIRNRTRRFVEWLGERPPTSRRLNEYIANIEASGVQPETVRGHRTSILAVLRFAGWQPDAPIRKVRIRERSVECYTLAELRQLLRAAESMDGALPCGLPLKEFWPLAIESGYSTALRFGDLVEVPASEVADDGVCIWTQSKTGRGVAVRFSKKAVAAIRRHRRDKAVPWPYSGNHFRTEFRAPTIAAGVRRGSWKWLRRSAGTYLEQAKPGFGHKLLGNAADIFRKHYWAYRLLNPGPLSPPEL